MITNTITQIPEKTTNSPQDQIKFESKTSRRLKVKTETE